jgi:hypothetical protein
MKNIISAMVIALVSAFAFAAAPSTAHAAPLSAVTQADVASKAATSLREDAGWRRRRWRRRHYYYRPYYYRPYYYRHYYYRPRYRRRWRRRPRFHIYIG